MKNVKNSYGFTIIEILVAIALLGIIFLVISSPITSLYGQNSKSSQTLNATTESVADMESARQIVLSHYEAPNNAQIDDKLKELAQKRNNQLSTIGDKIDFECKNITVTGQPYPDSNKDECDDDIASNLIIRRITLKRTVKNGSPISLYLDVNVR